MANQYEVAYMSKTMFFLTAATLAAGVFAVPVYYTGPVAAQEVRARAGVGHFMEKVKAGKEVTVAYLGGSIIAMNGWRNLTTDWLRATYPQAKFKEIHASIGGTGSNLGVFRVAHDALCHNPAAEFAKPKYQGTKFWPAKIMLVGDLVAKGE